VAKNLSGEVDSLAAARAQFLTTMAALDDGDTYEIDDLDALLDSEPVEADPDVEPSAAARAPTKVMTDYTRWNSVAKAIDAEDEEEVVETYNDEQQRTWEKMVKASGLREELKEELGGDDDSTVDAREPNEWRVVYSPCVAVREKPSTKSRMVGVKRSGALVGVEFALDSYWVKLKEGGFMMVHGGELGLGQLLLPNRGHYDDSQPDWKAPKRPKEAPIFRADPKGGPPLVKAGSE